jgi:hypothetical protein
MNWLILQPTDLSVLEEINATFSDRKIVPSITKAEESLLPDNFLEDPYWSAYHTFLVSLTKFEGNPVWPLKNHQITSEDEPSRHNHF